MLVFRRKIAPAEAVGAVPEGPPPEAIPRYTPPAAPETAPTPMLEQVEAMEPAAQQDPGGTGHTDGQDGETR
jgi:hypothetical protein